MKHVHVINVDYDHSPPVLLRSLRTLSLLVPAGVIHRLLPLIDAPQIRYLSVHEMGFRMLSHKSTTFDSSPLISAVLNKLANEQRRIRIKFWGQYNSLSCEYDKKADPRDILSIHLSTHFTLIFGFLRNKLQGCPLSIEVKRLQSDTLDAFFKRLATITNIQKISLDNPCDTGPFLHLLGHPFGEDGLETPEGPFRSLQSLVIWNSSISAIDLLLAIRKRYVQEKATTKHSITPLKLELIGVQRLSNRILAKMEMLLGPGQIIWRKDRIHPDETDGWSEQVDGATGEGQDSNDSQRRSEPLLERG